MSDTPASRILLIDDDRVQYRITQATFRRFRNADFTLEWAATFEEGLSQLLGGGYAACLLDYQLGERDGLELIRQAMGKGCRTPIVFLTSEAGAGVDIAALEAGAFDYLVKGEMTPGNLERSLRYALKLAGTLEALRLLATRDELTGLLNRREFERILAEESDRAQRFSRPLALILLDIDHFKQVNDHHGHPAGDAVLRSLARRLEPHVRSVDRLTRFGGEEFAVVLMETDQAAALECAQRLCEAVRGKPLESGTGELKVTISAGVAAMPADAASAADLVAAADKALYAAKAQGRDRAVGFSEI